MVEENSTKENGREEIGGGQRGQAQQQRQILLQGNAYDMFVNATQTKATKKLYVIALRKFMAFQKVQYVSDLLPVNSPLADAPLIQARIIEWIIHMREVEKLGSSTIKSYVPGVLLFYDVHDVILNKRKISRYLPRDHKIHNDRPYTKQEIAKLLTFCGPRERALVLLLASTGMRIGGVSELQLQHLHKFEEYGLYKITVYQGDPHEYYCFCTSEAAQAIEAYLEYRRNHGEKISFQETPEAPLIREEFNINNQGIARRPKKNMSAQALGDIISYKLERASIVPSTPLKEGQKPGHKRNHIARSHGFRKFVITTMINKRINETIRNLLTDHSVKLDKNYYGKTEQEVLSEYLKVVDDLTINEENRLRRKVELLEVKKSEYEQLKQQVSEYKIFQSSQLKQLQDQIIGLNEKIGKQRPYDLSSDIEDFRQAKDMKVAEEVMEAGQKLSREHARELIGQLKQQGYDRDKIIHEMAAYGLYDFEVIELMEYKNKS